MSASPDNLAAKWARLGVLLGCEPAGGPVRPEELLIETVRAAADSPRLFVVAASWISRFADLVDDRKLAALIGEHLEADHRPTMGLLLEWGSGEVGGRSLRASIIACGGALDARPLFSVSRADPDLIRVAEREATPLSKRWGRWMSETRLRTGALRSRRWVLANNPELMSRLENRIETASVPVVR